MAGFMFNVRRVLFILIMANSVISGFAQNRYDNSPNYNAAMLAFDKEDYRTCFDYLSKEITVHPDNGYAYYYLSVIYYSFDDSSSALKAVNQSILYLPPSDSLICARAFILRSKIYLRENEFEFALKDLNHAIQLCPKDLDIIQERANYYYIIKEYDKSDDDYNRMLGMMPDSPVAIVGIGRNISGRGQHEEAIRYFNNNENRVGEYSPLFFYRADSYYSLNRKNDAIDDVLHALEIDRNTDAYHLFTVIAIDDVELVERKLKAKISEDRYNAIWPYYLGFAKERNNINEEAISWYKCSLKLADNALVAKRISDCSFTLRDWNNALQYIDLAISMNPDNSDYLNDKATILWYADRLPEAIDQETRCIKACPNDYFYYFRRGWFKELSGDEDGALEDYTSAIERNDQFAYAYLNRGYLYRKKGFDEYARVDLEKCIKLDKTPSDNSCAQYALFYLGRISEAKEFMREALDRFPEESYYDAACLFSLMNLRSTALDYLEKALETGFDNYNHLLRDHDLDNLREEKRFQAIIEKYVGGGRKQIQTVSVSQKKKGRIQKETFCIPFSEAYGITKVNGAVNGYAVTFSYLPSRPFTVSQYQAEYFLSNGYIKKTDISGKELNGEKIPVGSIIHFSSISFGSVSFSDVQATVTSNDQSPLVFGDLLFGKRATVRKDRDRRVLNITR